MENIDATLDNIDNNFMTPLSLHYYKVHGNECSVPNFLLVHSLDHATLKKWWGEIDRCIDFLLCATDILKDQPQGWVKAFVVAEALDKEKWSSDEEDWDLGTSEEWIVNDTKSWEE